MESKVQTLTKLSYLARRTAFRSFFAESAIRGRTRATLQLRNIWDTQKSVKAQEEHDLSELLEVHTVLMQLSADSAITRTVITTSLNST